MTLKLYESKKWMDWAYNHKRWTETEIAEVCNVNQATINRWLKKHGLKKK